MSTVSWFHRFRGVNGFMVSWVSWCQGFHGFISISSSQNVFVRRNLFGLMRCLLVFCLCFLGCLLVVVGGGCSVDGRIEVCCLVL